MKTNNINEKLIETFVYDFETKDKLNKVEGIQKLNFHEARRRENPDSVFSFGYSFRIPEEQKRLMDDSEINRFILLTLGDRHSFESLMILQIIREIRATAQITLLYNKAKDYLIRNVLK